MPFLPPNQQCQSTEGTDNELFTGLLQNVSKPLRVVVKLCIVVWHDRTSIEAAIRSNVIP